MLTVTVHRNSTKNALTLDDAKALIGWTPVVKRAEAWVRADKDGNPTTSPDDPPLPEPVPGLKDGKAYVCLLNNVSNRPFRLSLARRYMLEFLRRKWQLNGETIIQDDTGKVQNGAHRLAAFILAELTRLADPKAVEAHYGHRRPLKLDCILVQGISSRPEVVDTLDLGQKRTLGDVIYRRKDLPVNKSVTNERTQKKLANILSHAVRLVWLRSGGKTVSDAPHFPHSEALDFLAAHPGIHDCVSHVYEEEGGKEKKISSYLSLGFAAGLCYLMAASSTDPDDYHVPDPETGSLTPNPEAVNLDNAGKAADFWALFASGAQELDPLRRWLSQRQQSGASDRDEVLGGVVNAFNLWMVGKATLTEGDDPKPTLTVKDIRPKKDSDPRLGGLDVVLEVEEVETAVS